jgi:hypothetical protein
MRRKYDNGQIFVPREPNRFWKAFEVKQCMGTSGVHIKYDILCYSGIREQGIDNKMMIMDQELMGLTMRLANQEEIKKLEL